MTNTNLLKAKIIENGFTVGSIAEKIGISHTSMSYKLNNKREFTASEMQKLCIALNITKKEPYFFNH